MITSVFHAELRASLDQEDCDCTTQKHDMCAKCIMEVLYKAGSIHPVLRDHDPVKNQLVYRMYELITYTSNIEIAVEAQINIDFLLSIKGESE